MMQGTNLHSREKGFALVVGLMLLLIITIIAVASMTNTHMQERMAGNTRTQVLAFEAASLGASSSLDLYLSQKAALDPCRSQPWDNPGDWIDRSDLLADADLALGVQLRQRFYCLDETITDSTIEDEVIDYQSRPRLFVLSRGEVFLPNGTTRVALRDIEVSILDRIAGDVQSCSAICMPGCGEDHEHSFRFPNSGIFKVDGGDGPSITTSSSQCAADLRDHLNDLNRIERYGGDDAIAGADGDDGSLGWPWDDANDVNTFVQHLRALSQESDSNTWVDGAHLALNYQAEDYTLSGTHVLGTLETPMLTFVEGNADMGGNVSGTGILVVNGDLRWNGTPEWNGLILVLGEGIELYGSGRGGVKTFGGSLVGLNLLGPDPEYDFGAFSFDFRGGGRGEYNYECNILRRLAVLSGPQNRQDSYPATENNLNASDPDVIFEGNNVPNETWWPRCDIQAAGDEETTAPVIVSWRENLGWRLREFADHPGTQ